VLSFYGSWVILPGRWGKFIIVAEIHPTVSGIILPKLSKHAGKYTYDLFTMIVHINNKTDTNIKA
jgi:hypothetical protein